MTSPTNPVALTEDEALAVCLRVGQVHAALARSFDRGLSGGHGLSYSDFVLLSHLDRAPEGRLRRTDLANAVGLSPSGVTRALGPLERIGLVERERNPRDARVAFASLTSTGREMVADARATAGRVATSALAGTAWTPDEVTTLLDLLGRLPL